MNLPNQKQKKTKKKFNQHLFYFKIYNNNNNHWSIRHQKKFSVFKNDNQVIKLYKVLILLV